MLLMNGPFHSMDLLQREGKYPLPPQASKTIMGVEFSGEVVRVHEGDDGKDGARKWNVGDAVFGLAYGVRLTTKRLWCMAPFPTLTRHGLPQTPLSSPAGTLSFPSLPLITRAPTPNTSPSRRA